MAIFISAALLTGIVPQASASIRDGATIQVIAEQAMTYPTTTRTNVPHPRYYPLPKGTKDTVVGNRISYTRRGETFHYYNLASGVRINADDIEAIAPATLENEIGGMRISREGNFTYVTLRMSEQVSYKVVNQAGSAERKISFTFANTIAESGSRSYDTGMFERFSWHEDTLTLYIRESNAFWGYEAYYEGRNLVFKFRHNPGSIEHARIAIDAGHGGRDRGAPGRNPEFHEAEINRLIAQELAKELTNRGATVTVIKGENRDGHWRRERAETWNADLLISIHCNSAQNRNATGTEVYFFHGFNGNTASRIARETSRSLESNNRGAKVSYYNITLSSQMRSVLIETGFMSNQEEYRKLIQRRYQQAIAKGIADAVERSF